MSVSKTLIQLDTDPRPSAFDSITAIDSEIDFLLRYDQIDTENVEAIVHGAMFTRGGEDLCATAIFVGGSHVAAGESVLSRIQSSFFGPCRVSVMLDSNGANTTAVAAVLAASRHMELSGVRATVLAGTGPVGLRTAELLLRSGADVVLTSRTTSSVEAACQMLNLKYRGQVNQAHPAQLQSADDLPDAIGSSEVVFACGAAGVTLWPATSWNPFGSVRVAVDLNAVPPTGIEAVAPTDKGKLIDGVTCYGAIGVGGLKMKIHKRCIQQLFEANDQVLDLVEIFDIGKSLI